jgi:transcriptional regulator NrdR family protein
MKCPVCKVWSFVLSTRKGVIRRRECANGHRFTTIETLKVDKPQKGVKNDEL